jgi:hypothetical protein
MVFLRPSREVLLQAVLPEAIPLPFSYGSLAASLNRSQNESGSFSHIYNCARFQGFTFFF